MAGAKINGKKRRVLTFSKGRADLVKKARQLAVLCDAQVALIIVSSSGTLYEYASSSMKSILGSRSQAASSTHASPRNNKPEINRILKEMKRLQQQRQRKRRGKENMALSFKDLQNLEAMLELGLNKVRLQKEKLLEEHKVDVARKILFYHEKNLLKEYDDLQKQELQHEIDQLGDDPLVLQESAQNVPNLIDSEVGRDSKLSSVRLSIEDGRYLT